MRPLAVLLVILYHLDQRLAPNGFVGVDVFFVISRFVVIRSTFSFSAEGFPAVAHFWRRRILRILPPLLLATGFTFFLIAAFTPPFPEVASKANIRTGIASLLGLGNLYLFKGSSDYFRNDSVTNAFLHKWSLGVEEQFYFLFALLFIFGASLIKLRQKRVSISLAIMSALGILSYAGFVIAANRNPLLVYHQ